MNGATSGKPMSLSHPYQSSLKNLLDVAMLEHAELGRNLFLGHTYEKVDEMPFDFSRRRLSVVVKIEDGSHILICKGAVEEIFSVSRHYDLNGELGDLDAAHFALAQEEMRSLNEDGFRVVAVAYKKFPQAKPVYSIDDESDLTLLGYIAFLDPPKESAAAAIKALGAGGVNVKILTGDNEIITRKICREVGIDPGLALQLHLSCGSDSMGHHDSEVMDGGSINRGDAGTLGVVVARGQEPDTSSVYAGAGCGVSWAFS